MKRTKVIRISPIPGTGLAESKDDARAVRQEQILPALESGQVVRLDFVDVDFATQSFVHALISEAIRRYHADAFERMEFANCTDEVQQVVLTVFEYTLAASDAAEGG